LPGRKPRQDVPRTDSTPGVPHRCVVDTNVAVTANGKHGGVSAGCAAASGRALATIMGAGHVFVDAGGLIVKEYMRNLRASGEPGPGDAFLRWVLTHEWNSQWVTRVEITCTDDGHDFLETPAPPDGLDYDPSDRKFLAVAAAHPDHPPILQSADSKWWGWRESLSADGVHLHFLCGEEIAVKHEEKMGR
jgi:hypothetical protein